MVVVARDEAPDKTEGGIVIPEQAKEPLTRGTVLAVGPGVREYSKLAHLLEKAWEDVRGQRGLHGAPKLDRAIGEVCQALRRRAPVVKPGDKVLFGKYTGNQARILDADGVERDCVLCREEELYGVIE